jgi:dihydrofolate reductase
MIISLIVAVSRNGVIGVDNQLPWHLPDDLRYFKSVTMGKPLIMGRKTHESIGRPLPGRANIVLTRDRQWTADGVVVVNDLDAAIAAAKRACDASNVDEVMIIGGEQIYKMTLGTAHRLYLTEVDADVEGDAFFPAMDTQQWYKSREQLPENTEAYRYRFVVLERKES